MENGSERTPLAALSSAVDDFRIATKNALAVYQSNARLTDVASLFGERGGTVLVNDQDLSRFRGKRASSAKTPRATAAAIKIALLSETCTITKLQTWWNSDEVRETRTALVKAIDSYLVELVAATAQKALTSATIAAAAGTQYELWLEITTGAFDRPVEPDTTAEAARRFLRGDDEGRWWTAKYIAIERTDIVSAIIAQAETAPIVFIHGPVGEGKSTAIRQTALAWLKMNRRVFYLKSAGILNDPAFLQEIQWQSRPLLILDGIALTEGLPAWFQRGPGDLCGCLLVGLQSRFLIQQKAFAVGKSETHLIIPPKAAEARAYVEKIVEHGAGRPGYGADDLLPFFQDGLGIPVGGGLWCAQWQATRGEYLNKRVEALVDSVFSDDARAEALAATVFINAQIYYSAGLLVFQPLRSVISALIANLDLTRHVIAEARRHLESIGSLLEGEFRGGNLDIQRDPVLAFRHPAISDALNRWIFGAKDARKGKLRKLKWPYFEALARALIEVGFDDQVFGLVVGHNKAWNRDRLVMHFRQGMLNHPRLKTVKPIAELALGVARTPRQSALININLAHASLGGYLGGTKGTDTTRAEYIDTMREYAVNRLITAFKDRTLESSRLYIGCAELMHDYNITLPAVDGLLERNWRYFAVRAYNVERSAKIANKVFELIATANDVRPAELSFWCERSGFTSQINEVSYNFLTIMSKLVKHCDVTKFNAMSPDFITASYDRTNFRSLRSIFLHFWHVCGVNRRLNVFVSNAGAKETNETLKAKAILERWVELDAARPDHWPEGVMAAVTEASLDRGSWPAFFSSYQNYFSNAGLTTPPPSAAPR